MRIVSLLPSATEIVYELGRGKRQVGRSHECDFPSEVRSLPVCTSPKFCVQGNSNDINNAVRDLLKQSISVYDVLTLKLKQLQPTHIITQSQCDVCAVHFKEVQKIVSLGLMSHPEIISLDSCSLRDVWHDIQLVADSLGVRTRGFELVSRLEKRLHSISSRTETLQIRPRVACIEWLEPLMAAGNWVPELVEMVGSYNLFGESGKHSIPIRWIELVDANPDVLIISPCGWNMQKISEELYWLTGQPRWSSLKAVQAGQVYITDGNQYFNRPGPRLVESAQILAEIIHPEIFPPNFEGSGWKRVVV